MENKNIFEELKELLENLTDSELVEIWNEYCDNNNYYDNRIESMDYFDDIMSGKTPLEIVNSICNDFNTNDDYFVFGVYGCESFNYLDEEHIYFDDLANYILDNDEDFDNDEIREFLDKLNKEEEEEE